MPKQTALPRAPRPQVSLPDVLQFMQLLWAVVHGLETMSKRMLYEMGVTGPQRLVLRVVGLQPGLSAGDLAAILCLHPSTLTGILKRLVANRMLRRIDDPKDLRRAVLRLTPTGVAANARRRGTVETAIAEALAKVTGDDRLAAHRVMMSLSAHLEGSTGRARVGRTRQTARQTGSRRRRA